MYYSEQSFSHMSSDQITSVLSSVSVDTTCLDFLSARSSYSSEENKIYLEPHYYNHPELQDDYFQACSESKANDPYVLLDFNFDLTRTLSTSLLNNAYAKSYSNSSIKSFYPIATRYISKSGYIVVERPPFQIDIDYKVGRASSSTKKRLTDSNIWIPWTIFIFNPNIPSAYKYYFSSSSLTNNNHTYISPYIPNTYTNGDICFSNSLSNIPEDSLPDPSDPSHFYATVFNDFFSGGWNSDLPNPWMSIFNSLSTYINNFDVSSFSSKYPSISRILFPSLDTIKPLFSKSSQIKQAYAFHEQNPTTCYSSIVYQIDQTQFHYYFLYIMSTFDLPDVLSLINEITSIQFHNKNHYVYSFDRIIKPYEEESLPSLDHLMKLATNKVASDLIDSTEYYSMNSVSAKVLILPSALSPLSSVTSPRSSFVKSYIINTVLNSDKYISISHKIISDYLSGKDLSSRIYVYDSHSASINSHILNSNISNCYHSLIKNNFSVPSLLQENQQTPQEMPLTHAF